MDRVRCCRCERSKYFKSEVREPVSIVRIRRNLKINSAGAICLLCCRNVYLIERNLLEILSVEICQRCRCHHVVLNLLRLAAALKNDGQRLRSNGRWCRRCRRREMIFLTLRSGGGGSLTRRNVLLLLLRVRGITVSRIGCRFGAVSVFWTLVGWSVRTLFVFGVVGSAPVIEARIDYVGIWVQIPRHISVRTPVPVTPIVIVPAVGSAMGIAAGISGAVAVSTREPVSSIGERYACPRRCLRAARHRKSAWC